MHPTSAQRRVLAAVNSWTFARRYQPTLREVGRVAGMSSTGTVRFHVAALVVDGWLVSDFNVPRSVRLGPRVAGSRNGLLAAAVPVVPCSACGISLPTDHTCNPLKENTDD